jgi:hypothetical protein
MPQQYGAAQPIADFFGYGKKPEKKPEAKPDTSWHDAQVKRANDSFQKQQVGKKPVPVAVQKRTAPLANKRTPRKKG